jgi:DNA-binding transcriptional LysR family regulator
MNWHDMSIILAVAREGSLTGAARILNVAHTTIGRRISDIEEKLGTKLFIRSRLACVPTEDCREILESIERMEVEALSIGAYFHDFEQKPRGLVKITTMPWIIQHIIVPALPTFTARFPEIELQLIADLRERSITSHETDLSLRFEMPPRNKEAAMDMAPFSYSLYAANGVDPHKLKWVTFWEDFFHYQPENWLRKKQIEGEEIFLRANDAGIVNDAIRTGVGKGLVPDFLAADDPELVRLSNRKPEITRTLKLLYHPGMRKLARIDAVISWLQGVFNSRSYTRS